MNKNFSFVFLSFLFIILFSFESFAAVPVPKDFPISNTYDNYIIERVPDGSLRLVYLESISDIRVTYVDNHQHFSIWSNFYEYHCSSDSWIYYVGGLGRIDFYCEAGSHSWDYIHSNFDIVYNGSTYLTKNEVNKPTEEDNGIFSSLSNFFSSLFDKLGNWFGSVIDYIQQIPSSIAYLFDNLGSLFSNLLNDIITYIKAIPQATADLFSTLFNYLFVPSDNIFNDFETLIKEKFGIFFQLKEIIFDLTTLDSSESAPEFKLNYAGHSLNIIDFSMFAQYRTLIHNIIILITSFFFIEWLIVSAPSIVMGQSVGEEGAAK